jgi:hypothetical protein
VAKDIFYSLFLHCILFIRDNELTCQNIVFYQVITCLACLIEDRDMFGDVFFARFFYKFIIKSVKFTSDFTNLMMNLNIFCTEINIKYIYIYICKIIKSNNSLKNIVIGLGRFYLGLNPVKLKQFWLVSVYIYLDRNFL